MFESTILLTYHAAVSDFDCVFVTSRASPSVIYVLV